MTSPFAFLHTRVARRVLFLFVLGALVPVVVMAVLSFGAVNRQLQEQSRDRLEQLTENAGQSIVQSLLLHEAGLRRVANALEADAPDGVATSLLPPGVETVLVQGPGGSSQRLTGPEWSGPAPRNAEQEGFLERGGFLVVAQPGPGARIAGGLALSGGRTVWARLHGDSLWRAAETFSSLPEVTGFCVLTREGPLHCSGAPGLGDGFRVHGLPSHRGVQEVEVEGTNHLAGYRTFHLTAAFGASPWTVVVSESEATVYAPVSSFAFSFPLALGVGVLLVLLLVNVQVRRTMGPLEALESGTREIAAGHLGTQVEVRSRDEFGRLAAAFNGMSQELQIQFAQLEASSAIDQTVLRSMDRDAVLEVVLQRFGEVVPARGVAVVHLPRARAQVAHLRWRREFGSGGERDVRLDGEDQDWLACATDGEELPGRTSSPLVRAIREVLGAERVRALPFRVKGETRGGLFFLDPGHRPHADELARGRLMADRAAVGLDEIRLMQEMEEMSWGTIRALARAIDAKSRWTAGHSERVTEMALGLAGVMGLPASDLATLHRGGLLHDVGKIGIPSEVLNLEGSLSPDHWSVVREHPLIGVRILEPIPALQPVLPIVRQHHERWDGGGYPDGIRGTEIHPLARVLAVADTYDAIVSARPYRLPAASAAALGTIVREAGRQFDPEPVAAFVTYMAGLGIEPLFPPED